MNHINVTHSFTQLFRFVCLFCVFLCSLCCAQDGSAIVKINDIIRVEVFNEPRVSVMQTTINRSGEATLPLLGQVDLAKLTLNEASEKIRKLYEADWLVDPKVTITVLKQADETISILGSVRVAGQLVIPPNGMDLSTAIATAGGLLETADTSRIELNRLNGQNAIYNQNDIASGAAGKIKLMSGDRIIVGQSPFVGKFVTVGGTVAKPSIIPFPLNGKLDLVSAIAFAGGLTQLSNGVILLTRDGKTEEINFNDITDKGANNTVLKPGDNLQAKMRWH